MSCLASSEIISGTVIGWRSSVCCSRISIRYSSFNFWFGDFDIAPSLLRFRAHIQLMERLHFITNICHKKAPMQKVRSFLHNLHRFWHPDTVFGDSFQHDRSSSACSCALPPSPVSYIIAKGESHNQDSPFPVAKKRKSGQRIRTAPPIRSEAVIQKLQPCCACAAGARCQHRCPRQAARSRGRSRSHHSTHTGSWQR